MVFFDGEEAGRAGSRHYVSTLTTPNAVSAMVNLDSVGRMGDRPLLAFTSDSAWAPILGRVQVATGVQVTLAQGGDVSDQQSFIDVSIPAIQLSSGHSADYHQPTDTADKVEPASLVAAAALTRELVVALRDRAERNTAP